MCSVPAAVAERASAFLDNWGMTVDEFLVELLDAASRGRLSFVREAQDVDGAVVLLEATL